jgi:hypothetical protein
VFGTYEIGFVISGFDRFDNMVDLGLSLNEPWKFSVDDIPPSFGSIYFEV